MIYLNEVERKNIFALLRESHMELLNYMIGNPSVSDEQRPMKVEIEYYEK